MLLMEEFYFSYGFFASPIRLNNSVWESARRALDFSKFYYSSRIVTTEKSCYGSNRCGAFGTKMEVLIAPGPARHKN
jgi:hypothetical protein